MMKTFKRMVRWLTLAGLTEDDQVGRALLVATLIIAVILLALNLMGPGL